MEETEEEQYQRLNCGTLPTHIWDIFPAHGQYIVQLMKFAGYQSRETIVKLKDPDEKRKMLSFAANHTFLLDEAGMKETFGIFVKKPEAVMILPGLETVFQRFIKTVENLIPKKKQANKRIPSSTSTANSTLTASESLNATTSSTPDATTKLNAENLKDRILNQIMKRIQSESDSPKLSREEAGIF